MSTKTLLILFAPSTFLFFVAAGVCFADASFQIEETAVYKNRYNNKPFSDYYGIAAVETVRHTVAWWKFEGNAGRFQHGSERKKKWEEQNYFYRLWL
jgi:hypothetical protein